MYGYFDLGYASIDFRGRYTIRIKIIPFDSLCFRIPFGWLKSIANIVPYPLTTKSDVGVNRHLVGIGLAFSLFNAEVYPMLVFVHYLILVGDTMF